MDARSVGIRRPYPLSPGLPPRLIEGDGVSETLLFSSIGASSCADSDNSSMDKASAAISVDHAGFPCFL